MNTDVAPWAETVAVELYSIDMTPLGSIHVQWADGRTSEKVVAVGKIACGAAIALHAAIPISVGVVVLVSERLGSIKDRKSVV